MLYAAHVPGPAAWKYDLFTGGWVPLLACPAVPGDSAKIPESDYNREYGGPCSSLSRALSCPILRRFVVKTKR